MFSNSNLGFGQKNIKNKNSSKSTDFSLQWMQSCVFTVVDMLCAGSSGCM